MMRSEYHEIDYQIDDKLNEIENLMRKANRSRSDLQGLANLKDKMRKPVDSVSKSRDRRAASKYDEYQYRDEDYYDDQKCSPLDYLSSFFKSSSFDDDDDEEEEEEDHMIGEICSQLGFLSTKCGGPAKYCHDNHEHRRSFRRSKRSKKATREETHGAFSQSDTKYSSYSTRAHSFDSKDSHLSASYDDVDDGDLSYSTSGDLSIADSNSYDGNSNYDHCDDDSVGCTDSYISGMSAKHENEENIMAYANENPKNQKFHHEKCTESQTCLRRGIKRNHNKSKDSTSMKSPSSSPQSSSSKSIHSQSKASSSSLQYPRKMTYKVGNSTSTRSQSGITKGAADALIQKKSKSIGSVGKISTKITGSSDALIEKKSSGSPRKKSPKNIGGDVPINSMKSPKNKSLEKKFLFHEGDKKCFLKQSELNPFPTVDEEVTQRKAFFKVANSKREKPTILKKPTYGKGNNLVKKEGKSKKEKATEDAMDYELDPVLLYRAIDTKQWGLAKRCLESNPDESRIWVYRLNPSKDVAWKFLPIHAACFSGAPGELVTDLIQAYPKSVQLKAHDNKLPLHIACEIGAHQDVVIALIKAYPDSLCAMDYTGKTPLELCQSGSNKNKKQIMKILTRCSKEKKLKFFGR